MQRPFKYSKRKDSHSFAGAPVPLGIELSRSYHKAYCRIRGLTYAPAHFGHNQICHVITFVSLLVQTIG
jgi:hypothetical protein